jgi:EAL domain-containing protein (putative c-di-GMP-specific phosphodiesterase class I)
MRMVVFDDEAAIGRLVVRVGALVGLEAVAVSDAEAFRSSLLDAPPQIVVLDLQLGSTDGVEQMRFLAESRFTGSLIVMSGFDPRVLEATASVARSLGLNVAAALTKPIRLKELEKVLEQLQSADQPITADRILAAIRDDELVLEFQPVVSRHPRTLVKLEALVRWNHPKLGRLPPGDFLPVAEADRTVIDALTDWVIDAAVDAWQLLHERGLNVPIAVNVSTQNLHDLMLPDRVARRMEAARMPASQLSLEITETAASRDTARMMDILTRMRLKGMELAIDDFGTGYSSLKALRLLPFSEIKIDRSFVADIVTSRDSRVIVKSIIDLASNLEMKTVAEGVETEDAARLLEEMNVDAMQGYLIARAMRIEAVPEWLAVWVQRDVAVLVPTTVHEPALTLTEVDDFLVPSMPSQSEEWSEMVRSRLGASS